MVVAARSMTEPDRNALGEEDFSLCRWREDLRGMVSFRCHHLGVDRTLADLLRDSFR